MLSQPLSAPSSYPERAWHRYVTQGNCVIHIQFLSPPPPFTALILPDIAVQDSDEEQIGAWQPVRCPKSLKAPQRRDPRRAFEAVPLTSMPLNGAPSLYIRATAVTGIVMLLLQTPSTDASDARPACAPLCHWSSMLELELLPYGSHDDSFVRYCMGRLNHVLGSCSRP